MKPSRKLKKVAFLLPISCFAFFIKWKCSGSSFFLISVFLRLSAFQYIWMEREVFLKSYIFVFILERKFSFFHVSILYCRKVKSFLDEIFAYPFMFWGFTCVLWWAELMLLGFISLLLTVSQGTISKFCVPERVINNMLPCDLSEKREEVQESNTTATTASISGTTRHLLAETVESQIDYCQKKVLYYHLMLFFIVILCPVLAIVIKIARDVLYLLLFWKAIVHFVSLSYQ